MNKVFYVIATVLCLALAFLYPPKGLAETEEAMKQHAHGSFEVKMIPETQDEFAGTKLGRMSLAKTFSGDLNGTGSGTMLTGMGQPPSSAAYVAVERFSGSLKGKEGSFILVHRGVMTQESQELVITVVPDSGTGELVGIQGVFHLHREKGKHLYDLEYTLP